MKGLICFIFGAAVGSIGTLIYVKKKVIPEIEDGLKKQQEEIDQGKEVMSNLTYEVTTDDDSEELVISDYTIRSAKVKEEKVDYTNYSKDTVTTPAPETPKTDILVEVDTEKDSTEPYLIDSSSFDEYADYTAHNFVMYSDGIVVDDETEEILDADPILVFGQTAIDTLKNGEESAVYIRDDSKKQDYYLERYDYPFDGPVQIFNTGDPDDWRE